MRVGWSKVAGVVALSAMASFGCAKKESGWAGDPTPPMTDPGPPVDPDPKPPAPTPTPRVLVYSGVYQANAAIDFTQNGALPGLTSPALGLLANLHTQPGTALVNFGYAAGLPILDTIGSGGRAILGSIIDGQITNLYMDNPELDRVVTIIQNIAQIAKTTVLQNKLTVHTPKPDHSTSVELECTGATFHFIDVNLMDTSVTTTVPAASAAAAKATFTTGTLAPRPDPNVADADITFDSATISIPMGDFLMQAIGTLVFQPLYGTSDFKTGLVKAIPCDDIADAAASAVSGTFPFITKDILKTVCTVGAGYLADQLISDIQKLSTDGVTISAGRGVLYDQSMSKPTSDGVSDRVGDGTWTWSIGAATVNSTYAGDKIATAL